MEIFTHDDFCIITPLSQRLDSNQTRRIIQTVLEHSFCFRIGIDMKYVEDCTIDFFDELKNLPEVSLFNIEAGIFTLLNIMNLDKQINLFVSSCDFLDNKHRIINRKLTLAS